MTTAIISTPRTLRDLLPQARGQHAKAISIATDVALVFGFALFTAAMAQVSFRLSFTPVPITGQTLAVLLSGAALGSVFGASSQLVYLALGLYFPFYADGAHGFKIIQGATGGYIVGFIFAAALIGFFAERGNDRRVLSAIGAFLVGTVVIYGFGATWLSHIANIPFAQGEGSALALGVVPFILGDVIKAAIASMALPASWKLVSTLRGQNDIDLTKSDRRGSDAPSSQEQDTLTH